MSIIWATRGRTWGFRFLRTGGLTAPLSLYEKAFSGTKDDPFLYRAVDGLVAARFPDPLGRQDRAGRVIPHEFVVLPPDAELITSSEVAQTRLWPQVAEMFSLVWDQPVPPAPTA